MVYCGPPSKGCSSCRDRKIRCDQKEPSCGQCEKRQKKCPGYRNMVDLMFRDESSHVIKKAQARQQRRRNASALASEPAPSSDGESSTHVSSPPSSTALGLPIAPTKPAASTKLEARPKTLKLLTPGSSSGNASEGQGGSPSSASLSHDSTPEAQQEQKQLVWTRDDSLLPSPEAGSWPATPMIARMYNLAPTWQERGTAYFFSRYVTIDENALHQRFDFIYDIWKPGSLASDGQLDGVMASMTAVGLVGVSQVTHSREIIDSARKSYGTALRLTNAALKDPKEAVKDTTMLSILILGVFEMMADPGVKTMKAWHEHVNGAVVLAKLRGVDQLRTHAGIRMFNMLCRCVLIASMQKHVSMPHELVCLQNELFSDGTVEHEPQGFSRVDLSQPMYKLLQMRRDIKEGQLGNLDGALARLDDIDTEFDRTISSFPLACQFKTFRVTRPHKAVYRDMCHIYPNLATASVWNWLRAGRVLALESVLATIQQHFPDMGEDGELVPPHYMGVYRKTWTKLERVTRAIVASTPQHVGLLNPVNPYFNTLKPVPTPLSTMEVREPPTPPAQSPASSASSAHTPSVNTDGEGSSRQLSVDDVAVFDDGGPTLDNPTRARTVEEDAERFMLLASATNTIVWPLYFVGVSSVCAPSLKAYVVERLTAIFDETGQSQARALASIVRNRELIKSSWLKLPMLMATDMPPPPLPSAGKSVGAGKMDGGSAPPV